MKNKSVAPFLKWVGGKRQLMPYIKEMLPDTFSTYFEPFVGGGAVLFDLQPKKAVINDYNTELVNVYECIKDKPNELIKELKKHKNESDYFYDLRLLDRKEGFHKLSNIKKASRVIYLNKTCYNGLYRVNSSGEFNSPFGRYKKPNIVNEATILAVSDYLNSSDVSIFRGDFEEAVKSAKKGDFVYFDPPYDPVSKSASFTGYVKGGFDKEEQIRLRDLCNELHTKGVKFMLSNSDTPFIEDLYKAYEVVHVKANRFINSNAQKRGAINELIIRNYG
ncbi:MAG: DNA adenine methylase [Arcticibacterium sp.]|jgi:DNA adenine methylase